MNSYTRDLHSAAICIGNQNLVSTEGYQQVTRFRTFFVVSNQ